MGRAEPKALERDQGLWHGIPLGPHGEGRGLAGLGSGSCQGLGGQLGGGAAAFPLHTLGLELLEELLPSRSVGNEGWGAKQKDRKWRWESWSPWRWAPSGQQLTCMC